MQIDSEREERERALDKPVPLLDTDGNPILITNRNTKSAALDENGNPILNVPAGAGDIPHG